MSLCVTSCEGVSALLRRGAEKATTAKSNTCPMVAENELDVSVFRLEMSAGSDQFLAEKSDSIFAS